MCKLKSAIILKNRIFMPDYDGHSKMLEELKITDDYFNASKVFVKAELSPADGDVFSNIDSWEFSVDQDITPEWFDEKDCAERMRNTVKEWAKTHIFIGQNDLKISHGENIFIKDCEDVDIYDNATVDSMYGNGTGENICDNATVKSICGNATVENICDNATVKYIYGNAAVKYIYGNATIENIRGNATVKYIYGNATVEGIYDNATVENICGDATVKNIYGDATVKNICGDATVENICDNATVKSSSYSKWNNSASFIISGNATFKDCYSRTIYQAGGWELVEVKNNK